MDTKEKSTANRVAVLQFLDNMCETKEWKAEQLRKKKEAEKKLIADLGDPPGPLPVPPAPPDTPQW